MEKHITTMKTYISLSFAIFAILVFISTSNADSQNAFFQCFSSNSQSITSISSLTYTPTNSSYQTILTSTIQNLRPSSILKPLAIITPLEESQIPTIITCSKLYGIEMRIRSGGHDYEGLSHISNVPFIIVDIRNLRSIVVDTESKTLWVQAGATLGELYYTVANSSRTLGFPAGVCPTVGVGGHFSGGGFGMISRKYGLAIDQIIDARIVDVNGRILDRESMGEDLFWAIRGGGGASFGVILAWKIKLVSVPEFVTVFNITRTLEQNGTELVHRWQYVADKMDENFVLRIFLRAVLSSQDGRPTVRILFKGMYLGGVEKLLQMVQESYPELGLVREDCTEMSWIDSVLYQWDQPRDTKPEYLLDRTAQGVTWYKGKSDYVTEPIPVKGLLGIWDRMLDNFGGAEFQFTPYGGRMSEISESELPYPHRAGTIYMVHYLCAWFEDDVEQAQRQMSWVRELYSYMGSYVSKNPRGAYFNYRDLDLGIDEKGNSNPSIWGVKYFKNNYQRLVDVKSKVDPTNFFKNEQSIPVHKHIDNLKEMPEKTEPAFRVKVKSE